MPRFSDLNTRNGTYDVIVPDSFTEKRINRVLEIAREYYSKLDNVINTVNSHLHFSGVRGRFSYRGRIEADLDANGNLKVYSTTRVIYGGVEIVIKRNVLGTKREITVESISEPKEVMVALNYLLRAMKVNEKDVVAISSTLLAIATITEGLGQNFEPDLYIPMQKTGKILAGEFSASFKFIDGSDVVVQKSDFSGEHIETVRDFYLKALSTIVAHLVQKGRFSTEALYGLLSYYNSNKRFLSVFYMRGLISSVDVAKAKSRYEWVDVAYEVLGNTIDFPLKKAVAVKWPPVKELDVKTPVNVPTRKPPIVDKAVRDESVKGAVRKTAEREPQVVVLREEGHRKEKEPGRAVSVGGGNLLLNATVLEKEILEKETATERVEVRKSVDEKVERRNKPRRLPPAKRSPEKTTGKPAKKKPVEKTVKVRNEVAEKKSDRREKERAVLDGSEPASLDNWTVPRRSVLEKKEVVNRLVEVSGKSITNLNDVVELLKALDSKCVAVDGFTEKLCEGLREILTEFNEVKEDNVGNLLNALRRLHNDVEKLASGKERIVASSLRRATMVVEREHKRVQKARKEKERMRKVIEERSKELNERIRNLLVSSIRVISASVYGRPGIRPLSRLMKSVRAEESRLKEAGINDYDEVVAIVDAFVKKLEEVSSKYPSMSPKDYERVKGVSASLEKEFENFANELIELKRIVEKLAGFEEYSDIAKKVAEKIDKVVERFSVSKSKARSKLKAYVSEFIVDVNKILANAKVTPPTVVRVKNTEVINKANDVIGELENLESKVKKSRIKDKDELIGLIEETKETVRDFIKHVEMINRLPLLTNGENARKGIQEAVEILRGVPDVPMFKSIKNALKKYLRTAGKKASVSDKTIRDIIKRSEEKDNVKLNVNSITIKKPIDSCEECPALVGELRDVLKQTKDPVERKKIEATIEVLKFFDRYPLAKVNKIKKTSPERYMWFTASLEKTKERFSKHLPTQIRAVLEEYYNDVAYSDKRVDGSVKRKDEKISLRTTIQSIRVMLPVRKMSYSDVMEKIRDVRSRVETLVEEGKLTEREGKQFIEQLDEIEKVLLIFREYPMSNRELYIKGVEEIKKIDLTKLPSRIRRVVEQYIKGTEKVERKVSVRRAVRGNVRSRRPETVYGEGVVRLVNHIKPEDISNLRYERLNSVAKSLIKFSSKSERVARLHSDIDSLSRILHDAESNGVKKQISIAPVINTNRILLDRLKADDSRITEERLVKIYVKLDNAKRELEVLKKTIEMARDVLTEKIIIEKVDDAIKIIDDDVKRVDGMLSEIESIAREKLNKGIADSVGDGVEESGNRRGHLERVLSTVIGAILRIVSPEESKIPDNVEEYPRYIAEKLSMIDTKRAFLELEDITPEVGKLRVMAKRYEEETGREIGQKGKIEALTKFALAIKELREESVLKPEEIMWVARAISSITSMKRDTLKVLIGGHNLKELIKFVNSVKEDAELIVRRMKEVESFAKSTGYNPVPEKVMKELVSSLSNLEKEIDALENAKNVSFNGVDVNTEIKVELGDVIELSMSKVRKEATIGQKKVEKVARSYADDMMITVSEALSDTIQSISVANRIGMGNNVSKLRVLLKGIMACVKEHNKAVEEAKREYETSGFFTTRTLAKIKGTATKVKNSCDAFIKTAEATIEEIKEKAEEHNKKTREKAISDKLSKSRKGKKDKGNAGLLKKAIIMMTTSGEEVHVDSLIDEIVNAEEKVRKIMDVANRITSLVDEIESREAVRETSTSKSNDTKKNPQRYRYFPRRYHYF